MIREAHKDRIAEFRSDRNLLDYADNQIAARMGMDKGNYSKYVAGQQRITRYFLTLFYQAFGDELKAIKLATGKANPTVEEKLEEITRRLDHLQQICERLAEKNI
jgi:transcriptional regulator with XRE-family HTH domain